ncbi:hypothetical protein JTB14_034316 [Gonioctena quinquepunctata]|nr:hypothetical protein JTB14_034316 [Gonioctena quinquepunctata]
MRKKNTITFISGNIVICCGTESENEENTNQPDSVLEQTIRDLVEENHWKCNYISKMKEENSVLESEALEMESKLNEQVEVQRQQIEKLEQQTTYHIQKLAGKYLETKTIETQTDKKHLEIKTIETQTDKKHLTKESLPDAEQEKKENTPAKKENLTSNPSESPRKLHIQGDRQREPINLNLYNDKTLEQEENKIEVTEIPTPTIIESIEQGTQTRNGRLYKVEDIRCKRKRGKKRQSMKINSFEVEILNDDNIQPSRENAEKLAPETPETESTETSPMSIGNQTSQNTILDDEVVVNLTNDETGSNIRNAAKTRKRVANFKLPECINNRKLTLLLINIQSIRNKIDDLYIYLENLDSPKLVLVTEHWLNPQEPICVPGYKCISRFDRVTAEHGGTLILDNVNEDIFTFVNVEKFSNLLEEKNFEFSLVYCDAYSLYVLCIYRTRDSKKTPSEEMTIFFEKLERLLSQLPTNSNIVLTGDLNINFEDKSNRSCQLLEQLLDSFNLTMHVKSATHICQNASTIIDYICSNVDESKVTCSGLPANLSDHEAVLSTLNFPGKGL